MKATITEKDLVEIQTKLTQAMSILSLLEVADFQSVEESGSVTVDDATYRDVVTVANRMIMNVFDTLQQVELLSSRSKEN